MEQDDLHALVHSLTKAEKKFFRQYAGINTSGESAYFRLFEAIEKQKTPDDNALAKKFSGNYRYLRHYLHSLILQSLTVIDSDDAHLSLNAHYAQMVILYKKSLYRAAQRQLSRLYKLADAKEDFSLLLRLAHWQRRLFIVTDYKLTTADAMRRFEEEVMANTARFSELQYLMSLSHRFSHFMRTKGTPAAPSSHHLYEDLMPVVQGIEFEKLQSVRAKLEYHHVHGSMLFGLRRFAETLPHIQQEIDIILAHQQLFEGEEQVLVSRFNNMLAICVDLHRWDMLDEYLEKLKAYSERKEVAKNKSLTARISERLLAFRLRKSVDCVLLGNCTPLETETEQLMESDEPAPSFRITFCFYLSILNLMAQRQKQSAAWLKQLQYETDQDVRKDLHAFARIVELLLTLEEGSPTHIESVLRSAKRQLQQTDHFNTAEQEYFRWFSKYPLGASRNETAAYFISFQQAIRELSTHSRSSPSIDKMIEVWISNNLTNASRVLSKP